MNCYYHPDRPAVIQCRQCGKGLCSEDAANVVDGICPECQLKNTKAAISRENASKKITKDWYKKTLMWAGIFCGVGLFCGLMALGQEDGERMVWMLPFCFTLLTICYRYSSVLIELLIRKTLREGTGCLVSVPFLFIVKLVGAIFIAQFFYVLVADLIVAHFKGKGFIPLDV